MNKNHVLLAAACLMGFSAAMAAEALVPNSLADARIGEWASYRVPNGYIQKLTVVKRDGQGAAAQVTVKVDNIYEGEVITSTEVVRDAGEPLEPPRVPDEPGIKVEIEKRTMTIKGKSVEVTEVEIDYDDAVFGEDYSDVEWQVSPDIPVFGIIKREEDGSPDFELVDFGES